MQQFEKINKLVGWLVFLFALIVYSATMESTASFWDCGEFIAGAYKLEVVHPPGAPFFLMLGRIFTLLSFGDPSLAAVCVNFLSASSTAFAVLFLFWSFTALARKLVFKDGDYSTEKTIAVIGAGVVASVACTFLDSLWFSAVEGEVYALSMFFMAFVLWAILKWEASNDKHADRWLLLIAFAIGLSTGVHLLSLLVVPVAGAVYYYKKFNPTLIGFFLSQVASFITMGFIMKVIIPGIPNMASSFDLFFVNSMNMPFNTGAFVFFGLLFLAVTAAIGYTQFTNKPTLNTIVLAITFIMIGFSSYFMVPIRSSANPPINMNKPVDPFSITSYLNREQYGDRPLTMGPSYVATQYDLKDIVEGKRRYIKGKDRYIEVGRKMSYEWKDNVTMLFPRMGFWQEKKHERAYRAWINPDFKIIDRAKNNAIVERYSNKELQRAQNRVKTLNGETPSRYAIQDDIGFAENIQFFLKYQIGYMYMRYFMWNFAGRQNDIQGMYSNDDGGWVSGIHFIDDIVTAWGNPVGKQKSLAAVDYNNGARNHFYFLPFLLGLFGLVWHASRGPKNFSVVFLLFFVTGILQIIYHNQPPVEPRERDYVLAGSFYAYAMWIGFGVLGIWELLRRALPGTLAPVIAIVICMIPPALMGINGWNDHNRHGHYIARDIAVNYLESCAPNAIIFTQGDNDTYPLWYAQEVEGVRPDVRTVNLSLLGVDWYIDQLRYKVNEAPPLKLSFTKEQVSANNRDVTRFRNRGGLNKKWLNLSDVMNFIASEDPKNKVKTQQGEAENFLPTKKFVIPVDTNQVKAEKWISPKNFDKMTPDIRWEIEKGTLLKNDLMTLDIVANNLKDRPIYFAVSVAPSAYMGLEKFFQLEGLTYRIVPMVNPSSNSQTAPAYTEVMYDNMMNKFKWGNMDKPGIVLNENVRRMSMNLRSNFIRLAKALVKEGQNEKAKEVMDRCREVMPEENLPNSIIMLDAPDVYYQIGDRETAQAVTRGLVSDAEDRLRYFSGLPTGTLSPSNTRLQRALYTLQQLTRTTQKRKDEELSKEIASKLEEWQIQLEKHFPGSVRPG